MAKGTKADTKGKKKRQSEKGRGKKKTTRLPSVPYSILSFPESLERKVLTMDGPPGTLIQRSSLTEEDYRKSSLLDSVTCSLKGNFPILNLSRPDVVADVHRRYIIAGADVIRTNTHICDISFQTGFGTEGIVPDMVREGVRIARESATSGVEYLTKAGIPRNIFVAGVVGQGLRSLSFEKMDGGQMDGIEKEVSASYALQVRSLTSPLTPGGPPGIDFILLEDFYDPSNAVLALEAALSEAPDVPVMISICPDPYSRSMLTGEDILAFHSIIEPYSPMGFGLGGTLDPRTMCHILKEIKGNLHERVVFCCFGTGPNSGAWIYDEKPNIMGVCAERLAEAGILNMIGSSDWTDQEHTCAMNTATSDLPPRGYVLPPASHGRKGEEDPIPLTEEERGDAPSPDTVPEMESAHAKTPEGPSPLRRDEWMKSRDDLLGELRHLCMVPSPASRERALGIISRHLSELHKFLEEGALSYIECAESLSAIIHDLGPLVLSAPIPEDISPGETIGLYTPPMEPSPVPALVCESILRLCGIRATYRGTLFSPDPRDDDGIMVLVSMSSRSLFLTEDLCRNLSSSPVPLFLFGESSSVKHAALRLRDLHPRTYYHPRALEAAGYILGYFRDRDNFLLEERAHTTNIIIDYVNHRNGLSTPVPKNAEALAADGVNIVGSYSRRVFRSKTFYGEKNFRATPPTIFSMPGSKVISSFDLKTFFTLTGNEWDGKKLKGTHPLRGLHSDTKSVMQAWVKEGGFGVDILYCVLPSVVQMDPLVDKVSMFLPGEGQGDSPALSLPFLSGGDPPTDPRRRGVGDFVPCKDDGTRGPLGLYALRVNHGKTPPEEEGKAPFPYCTQIIGTLLDMARKQAHDLLLSTITSTNHSRKVVFLPVGEGAIPDGSLGEVITSFLGSADARTSIPSDFQECGVVIMHECAAPSPDFSPSPEAVSRYRELRGIADAPGDNA